MPPDLEAAVERHAYEQVVTRNREDAPGFGEADLTNCDREPIHIPGSIQPHGLLLALDPHTHTIGQAGGDAPGLVGRGAASLLGAGLDAVLDPRAREHVAALIADADDATRPVVAIRARGPNGATSRVAVHSLGRRSRSSRSSPATGRAAIRWASSRASSPACRAPRRSSPISTPLAREVRVATG